MFTYIILIHIPEIFWAINELVIIKDVITLIASFARKNIYNMYIYVSYITTENIVIEYPRLEVFLNENFYLIVRRLLK